VYTRRLDFALEDAYGRNEHNAAHVNTVFGSSRCYTRTDSTHSVSTQFIIGRFMVAFFVEFIWWF
jgi:hypothetical protein